MSQSNHDRRALDIKVKLHTVGYQDRPAAWMREYGIGLNVDEAFNILLEHIYPSRNRWMVPFTVWLVNDERFGCLHAVVDEAHRAAVGSLVEVLRRGDATEAEILDAAVGMGNLLDSHLSLPVYCALSAAVNVATSRSQFARGWANDDYYLARWLKSAVVALTCTQDNVEEFQVAIADTIEQAMYPGRAPLGREGGCPTARMLRAQALSRTFAGKEHHGENATA